MEYVPQSSITSRQSRSMGNTETMDLVTVQRVTSQQGIVQMVSVTSQEDMANDTKHRGRNQDRYSK